FRSAFPVVVKDVDGDVKIDCETRQHDTDSVNGVVVVFVDRMGFNEGIYRHKIDAMLFYRRTNLSLERTGFHLPGCIIQKRKLLAYGGPQDQMSANFITADIVVLHRCRDPATQFVPSVL